MTALANRLKRELEAVVSAQLSELQGSVRKELEAGLGRQSEALASQAAAAAAAVAAAEEAERRAAAAAAAVEREGS
eukprot:4169317-Pleurochrysis_carterae.AAC.1